MVNLGHINELINHSGLKRNPIFYAAIEIVCQYFCRWKYFSNHFLLHKCAYVSGYIVTVCKNVLTNKCIKLEIDRDWSLVIYEISFKIKAKLKNISSWYLCFDWYFSFIYFLKMLLSDDYTKTGTKENRFKINLSIDIHCVQIQLFWWYLTGTSIVVEISKYLKEKCSPEHTKNTPSNSL